MDGDGGDADHQKARDAHAGHDDRPRERQLGFEQLLAAVHPHATSGLHDGRVDLVQTGDGVAQDGQHAVEDQPYEGGQVADALQPQGGQAQRGDQGLADPVEGEEGPEGSRIGGRPAH